MKRLLSSIFSVSLLVFSQLGAQDLTEAQDLFKMKCGICHSIGMGRIIGPDLANVHQRRDQDWLLEYIRSSQQMINGGDPDAVALFEEYNKVIMPDPMISDGEIISLLNYIAERSGDEVGAVIEVASLIEDATQEDIDNGKKLFEGKVRFSNGGPSCFSCHNDLSDIFFSENSYSTKDISTSFSDLGERGVAAILSNPPFPVMAQAFNGHQLEDEEIHDLLIYLQDTSAKYSKKRHMSSGYILYGVLGAFTLFLVYGGLWYNRKTQSVNNSIYRRQIKSFN